LENQSTDVDSEMRILVLGGYGGTGRVYCRYLLKETPRNVIVAERNRQRAEAWAETLKMEVAPDQVSARHVEASDRGGPSEAFRHIDLVLAAATTTQFAEQIAEAALAAHIDYLDIYYQQNVYPVLEALRTRITESWQYFITQAGFHPGFPVAFVRKGDAYFDIYDSAIIAFAMNTRIEKPESIYELVDALADYKADVVKEGRWRPGTYRDAMAIDFGLRFDVKSCVPLGMVEIRPIPEMYHLKELGVDAAGFNWFVDYVVFPLIVDEGAVFLLHAKGGKGRDHREISIRSEHHSAYDFTVIPVIATLKQDVDGSIRKPGLWMMGHIVDPDRLFADMGRLGVKIQTRIARKNAS
jgi:uncharacterized protein YbjT (DUF2867 family)